MYCTKLEGCPHCPCELLVEHPVQCDQCNSNNCLFWKFMNSCSETKACESELICSDFQPYCDYIYVKVENAKIVLDLLFSSHVGVLQANFL